MDAPRILTSTASVGRLHTQLVRDAEGYRNYILARAARDLGLEALRGGVLVHDERYDDRDDRVEHTLTATFCPPGCVVITKERLRFLEETAAMYRGLCK
jgi:hypothetical protein